MRVLGTGGLTFNQDPYLRFVFARKDRTVVSGLFGLLTVFFAVLLLLVYRFYVVSHYGYMGLTWDPTPFTIGTGIVIAAALAVFMPVQIKRAGDMVLYPLFLIAVVPSLILPSARSTLTIGTYLEIQLAFALCFVLLLVFCRFPVVNLSIKLFSPKSFSLFLVIATTVMLIPLVYYFGLPSSLPGLYDVYDRRLASRGAISEMPTIVGYFWFWMARVFVPFLVIFGIARRSRSLVLYGLVIAVYLFALTGLKSVVFAVGLVCVVAVLVRILGRSIASVITLGILTFLAAGALADFLLGFSVISDLLTRRTFIVPGLLTEQYWRFYADSEFSRWSYSFLGSLYDNPYAGAPAGIVGSFYGQEGTTATVHVWANGYANFGYPGMVFVTVIVGLIVWFLNSVTVGKSAYVVIPLVTMIGYLFANTEITTALVTHGILPTLLLLQLSPADDTGDIGCVGRENAGSVV